MAIRAKPPARQPILPHTLTTLFARINVRLRTDKGPAGHR
jgi:hypothetical protein